MSKSQTAERLGPVKISKFGGARERYHIEIPADKIDQVRHLLERDLWLVLVDIEDMQTAGSIFDSMRKLHKKA